MVCRGRSVGGRPALVFMHHPPLDTGDAFFDTIGLQDRESFETVQSLDSIKGIGFGHLHRSLNLWENPWVEGAPSTAFGMMKQQDGWLRSTERAGYLLWCLMAVDQDKGFGADSNAPTGGT